MSLYIYLTKKGKFTYDEGVTFEDHEENVFDINITHNLGKMAQECGLYEVLWCPKEIGVAKAKDAIELLTKGLKELESDPKKYKEFNPENGWGSYEGLVYVTRQYLEACINYPESLIEVSR